MNKKIKVIEYGIDDEGTLGVYAISVVEQPAIGVDFVALSEQHNVKFKEDFKGLLYGPLLIPDQLIYRRNDETNEEYYVKYSKETIRQIAYNYMKQSKQNNATVEHQKVVDGVSLVEAWVIEGEHDKSMNFNFSLPEGTWFGALKVENDEVKQKVLNKEVLGFSIEGNFIAEKEMYMSNQEPTLLEEIEQAITEEIAMRYDDYMNAVNMTFSELKAWSETECSMLASLDRSPIERNLELLSTNKDEWTNKHFDWAGKTIAFINRMRENTAGDLLTDSNGNDCGSKRTISLKNWAYDPNK